MSEWNIVKFSADGETVYAMEAGGEYIWCEQDKAGNITRKSKRKTAQEAGGGERWLSTSSGMR